MRPQLGDSCRSCGPKREDLEEFKFKLIGVDRLALYVLPDPWDAMLQAKRNVSQLPAPRHQSASTPLWRLDDGQIAADNASSVLVIDLSCIKYITRSSASGDQASGRPDEICRPP